MRTIAIINQKGGCGKTTVSINLAAALARREQRTLLLDMDAQSHCALGLAVPEAHINRSVTDLMHAGLDGSITLVEVVWRIARHLDLAPSTMDLSAVEQMLITAADRDARLTQILSTVQDRYDYCVIDCPPSLGLLTFNAFRAADEVIIPVETGYFALHGSIRQQRTMDVLAQRVNHDARFSILPTMYDVRTRLARELLGQIREHFGDAVLPAVIHFNSRLREAAGLGQSIMEYDPSSRGMQDFEELAGWLMENPPMPRRSTVTAPQQVAIEAPTGLSRAAELVERARALSNRAATLSRRFGAEPAVGATDDELNPEQSDLHTPAPGTPGSFVPGARTAPQHLHLASDRPPSRPESMPPGVARLGPIVPRPPKPLNNPDVFAANVHIPLPERRLAAMARLFGVRRTSNGLLFVQPANASQSVAITGDFNDWNPQGQPMTCDRRLGIWQTTVQLKPGRYHYRLIIDGQSVPDPYNKQIHQRDDGHVSNYADVA